MTRNRPRIQTAIMKAMRSDQPFQVNPIRRTTLGLWLVLLLGSCAPLTGIYLLQGSDGDARTVPTAPPDEPSPAGERNAAPGLEDVAASPVLAPSDKGQDDTGVPVSPSPTAMPSASPPGV